MFCASISRGFLSHGLEGEGPSTGHARPLARDPGRPGLSGGEHHLCREARSAQPSAQTPIVRRAECAHSAGAPLCGRWFIQTWGLAFHFLPIAKIVDCRAGGSGLRFIPVKESRVRLRRINTWQRSTSDVEPEALSPLCLLRNHGQLGCVAAIPARSRRALEELAGPTPSRRCRFLGPDASTAGAIPAPSRDRRPLGVPRSNYVKRGAVCVNRASTDLWEA
jgi:hypothetical protein